jgi:hypothetical protein
MEPPTSVVDLDDLTESEAHVHEWRVAQLRRLGVRRTRAQMFASLVDWHEIADLVERGCPPELALEILR